MVKTSEDHKRFLIDHLRLARKRLLGAVQQIPPEYRDRAFIGDWSVKELVAHLTGWDYTNLQAAQEIMAGQRPQFFKEYDADWRSYNAWLVETYRVEPFEELMAAVAASHEKFTAYLRSLSADDILRRASPKAQGRSVTIRSLLRAETEDEREHGAQVLAFLEKILAEKRA